MTNLKQPPAVLDFRRTHNCGVLRKEHIGTKVKLSGWVHRRRDHGGLIFVDLRDRYGLTQLVFDPCVNAATHDAAEALRAEWVLTVEGEVIARAEGMANSKLATGDIEVEIAEMSILSKAKTPPFSICDEFIEVNEELRLKYRYLDMRRGEISRRLAMRHKAMLITRNLLDRHDFLEVTTPILGKSTPEGARDYLVPSRIYPGHFYALPQSPQIFKQLLMISGMDRYFQIVTCFRDEDLRSARQPEFTQIDMEMSFTTEKELFPIIEKLLGDIFRECKGVELPHSFRRMTYHDCMERYGTDKPDLRFGMELVSLDDIAQRSSFSVFTSQLEGGGIVKGMRVEGGAEISRRIIDEYTRFVGKFGVQGLAWMKMQKEGQGLTSSIVKFFDEELQKELIEKMQMQPGDLLLMIADTRDRTLQAFDHLRRKIARERGLIDPKCFEVLWVTDFPLYHWDEKERRMVSEHHPFTSPVDEDIPLLDTDPLKVRSSSYDIVINGYECGSGSQRIHCGEVQRKVFEVLKLTPEEIQEKFGFFVESLQYGTPPHLGIALGLDRLMMLLTETENIRDVIAFPKTQKASDLMTEAPSPVTREQLDELYLSVDESEFPSS